MGDLDPGKCRRLLETGFGRWSRWHVERDGQPIALLDDPQFEDMFWYSYRIQPLTNDPELISALATRAFWLEGADLVYRSVEFGDVAEHAFPGGLSPIAEGRICMRALCLYQYVQPDDDESDGEGNASRIGLGQRIARWWRSILSHKPQSPLE